MNSSQSSVDARTMSPGLPQHLISGGGDRSGRECGVDATSPRRFRRASRSGRAAVAAAIPCLLLAAATTPAARALSLSSTSNAAATSRSLVDQARMIRELKSGTEESQKARQRLSFEADPLVDNDALSAALFDDDFNNSLESAVANLKRGGGTAKSRAEEFDRFMEEDANVASIVQENIKPGSLVDAVQQSKGADVEDMEAMLQREAADRRKSRDEAKAASLLGDKARLVSKPSSIKVTRKTKLASTPRATPPKANALLTREQEYALARTIQSGSHVHKLKAEYESANGSPLSKKQWAETANMSPNDLRKLISDYRTAKQELVSSNMGLVHAVVRNYARKAKFHGVSEDELIQEGSLGLIRAAELFDPEKGLRFSTYATIWIKGVLSNSNALDGVVALPNREKVIWNKVRAAREDMASEEGDERRSGKPSVSSAKEIAKRLDMKPSLVEQHLRRMHSVSSVLSLDYQYATSTRSGHSEGKQDALVSIALFGTDADLAERAQFKADVVAGLVRNLTERELTLMRLRYGLEDGTEYTIKDCADKMGINRETARLLQHKCLKKLREASNMESLQEYLLTVA